ncbi:MAG: NADH-quinone oxidoreductase subunit C [Chloroflexi bacterium]|nr:NADH-quinone oxidoreductase subunit C [Chloroflexota bacterium]
MKIPQALDPVLSTREALDEAILDTKEVAGETTLIVNPADLVRVARFVRDTSGLVYNYLSDISAVDYYPEVTRGPQGEGRFGVSYHLYSMLYNRRIRLKVYLPEDDPAVSTVTVLWKSANWLEREIFDMMGIRFDGHPDLRRLLMAPDWDGHPHRRDYPLGYETIMFSFNKDEINQHKPYAKKD